MIAAPPNAGVIGLLKSRYTFDRSGDPGVME
jgi:hypothetical protein